jgi:hypothetical protein
MMKNEDFMIYQTTVRKYVGIYEKVTFIIVFPRRFYLKKGKKNWTKNDEKFS